MEEPVNASPVDSKVEMPLELCEEEDDVHEPISTKIDNWLVHWKSGKKRDNVPPWLHK